MVMLDLNEENILILSKKNMRNPYIPIVSFIVWVLFIATREKKERFIVENLHSVRVFFAAGTKVFFLMWTVPNNYVSKRHFIFKFTIVLSLWINKKEN